MKVCNHLSNSVSHLNAHPFLFLPLHPNLLPDVMGAWLLGWGGYSLHDFLTVREQGPQIYRLESLCCPLVSQQDGQCGLVSKSMLRYPLS